jgi:hypothetical protein
MTDRRLKQEFEKRGPWVTGFQLRCLSWLLRTEQYGGQYVAAADVRLKWFFENFPSAQTVLELGSLEGGHSFALARRVTRVVALEGRGFNIHRARFVQRVLGLKNVAFHQSNLETDDLSKFGRFDVVFNLGLLYHLPAPLGLLEKTARVSDGTFLWTHYCLDKDATTTQDGVPGCGYNEFGHAEPLSGLSMTSFWPTRAGLDQMLQTAGYSRIKVIHDSPDHPHGPEITLAAWR